MRRSFATGLLVLACFSVIYAEPQVHVVQEGETLFSLSRRYQVSLDKLRDWNDLKNDLIYVGQKIRLEPEVKDLQVLAPSLGSQQVSQSADQPTLYIVKQGDNLGLIAQQHSLSVNQLRAWNNLSSTDLLPNEKLVLKEPAYLQTYTVKKGDTLSAIAREKAVSLTHLLAVNHLHKDSPLKLGQILRLDQPKANQAWHYLKKGETLSELGLLYGVSEAAIRSLSALGEGQPVPGSLLKIRELDTAKADQVAKKDLASLKGPSHMESNNPVQPKGGKESGGLTHTVQTGDTLYSIARQYKVLIEDLKSTNGLQDNFITKGTVLNIPSARSLMGEQKDKPNTSASLCEEPERVRLSLNKGEKLPETVNLESTKPLKKTAPRVDKSDFSYRKSLKSLVVLDPKIPLYEWNGDYYYWKHPELTYQPSRMYFEQWDSPLDAYRKATELFNAFTKLVESRPKISQILEGKTIIIDPGHGGLDPGAIVKSKDGLGRDIYITEDEYVYDIALRMYVLLKEHGADVTLTILAPDHLIRDTSPASNTLVNMKNEVYNLEALNARDSKDCWPTGTQEGLARRVEVIKHLAQGKDSESLIFVSLHADNQPALPRHTGILYQHNCEMNDGYSQKMAEVMQEAMNKERVYVKGQDLYVLRNAPLKYKVLVELRNVSSPEEAWALRFADMRQGDAEKVVKGILALFRSLT